MENFKNHLVTASRPLSADDAVAALLDRYFEKRALSSTGQYCAMYKASDNYYYMVLEKHTYGPFDDEKETNTFLERHFANPGGYSIDHTGKRKPPKTVKSWYHNRWVDSDILTSIN